MTDYFAITPARDEEKFLPHLIKSMTSQTVPPKRWIVIDDGSTDASPQILDEAARKFDWIEVHHLPGDRVRLPGGESVVMQHLPRDAWQRYEYVLRVDADVSFGSRLAQHLLAEFARDRELGIAGPTLYEPSPSGWFEVNSPRFHVHGPIKMYSRQCFQAIGGLEPGLGWDTIDETHALMLGYRTWSFRHIRALHHRPQGEASGPIRARLALGRAAYYAGYSPAFMMVRAVRRSLGFPPLLASGLMLAGFFEGYLRHWPRPATPELIKFVRRQQIRRLLMMESLWR